MQELLIKIKQSYGKDKPSFITAGFIILSFAVFPLIVGSRGYGNITEARHGVLVIGALAYFVLLFLICLREICRGTRKFSFRCMWHSLSLCQKLILLYALLCLISALCSPYQDSVWTGTGRYEGLFTIYIYIGIFLAVSSFGKFHPAYLYALFFSVIINCLLAQLQFVGGNPLHLYPTGYNYYDGNTAYSGEFLGTIGNSGLLCAFLCLAIPAFICYFIRRGKDNNSYALLAAAVLSLYVMIRSGIAAGIVGLLGAFLLIIPVLMKSQKARLIYAGVIIILVIICLILVYNCNGFDSGPLFEASSLIHGHIEDSFGSGRIGIWRETLNLLPQKPLLGGGPDTLKERLDLIFTHESNGMIRQTIVDNAHNDYLNIAANIGIPGLIVYLCALVCSAVGWFRHYRNTAVLVCGAAVLCYSIQIFFSFSLCVTAPLFWLFWGLLESALKKRGSN